MCENLRVINKIQKNKKATLREAGHYCKMLPQESNGCF